MKHLLFCYLAYLFMELFHCSVRVGFLCDVRNGMTDNDFKYVFIHMTFLCFRDEGVSGFVRAVC